MNPLGKLGRGLLAGLALAGAAALALAQSGGEAPAGAGNSIDNLQVSSQGGVTLLKLTLKKPLPALPGSFSIANPARLAFDFPDTENGLGRPSQQVNEGELRSLNVVQVGGRTRLVLNLKKMTTYEVRADGENLYISLAPAPADITVVPLVTRFAEARPHEKAESLRDISFRRGKNGEARILVDLSDPSIGIDVRQQGSNIVVDFLKTALPEKLRRRLDVADFATPVTSVATATQGDNVRMTITPGKGQWEHSAYQSDNQFVVEVKSVATDPNKLVQGARAGYQGEKLSLNFQNVEVRAVLQVIADFTNFNIITSDTVAGSLTLRLKDVPWDQALDIILQTKGLDSRKNGNVILIAPRDEIAAREKSQLESKQQISQLELPQTESFVLSFQKADTIKATLSDKMISKQGVIISDAETNTLFVKDIPANLEKIRDFIQKVDVGARQVMIEARIVEADDGFSENLGARLGYNDQSGTVPGAGVGSRVGGGTFATVSGNMQGLVDLSSQGKGGGTGTASVTSIDNTQFVNMPASGLNGVNPGTFAISLFKSGLTKFINLEISALESDTRGKVISSPRVVTADKVKAVIEQGTEIPYQIATASGATAVAFRKASLKLEVTPHITPVGSIILDLEVNKDSPGVTTASGVQIDTKHIKTKVAVENGGTVVIGGIFLETVRDDVTRVPFFGDIPVVGNLFKSTARSSRKTELMIFITPRVIDERLTLK